MDAKKQQYAGYLDIISKAAKRKVVGANIDLREDVVQEAFMKVIRSDFFSNHDIKNPDNIKVITSYIYMAINSCLLDELQKQGRLRRSWLSEKEMGGKSYISIESSEIVEDDFL
jgi:DNA-directed RNA polymerase specialized sigma24 family protein